MTIDAELLEKKLANWQRLRDTFGGKSFGCQKEEVLRLEDEMRGIIGGNPDWLHFDILGRNKEELELLLV